MRHALAISLIGLINLTACLNDDIIRPGDAPPSAPHLRIDVGTIGADLDTDGYSITVDQGAPLRLSTEGAVILSGIAEGPHSVTIDGVAENCVLIGPPQRTVVMTATGTTETHFDVTCSATGITLTIQTKGRDQPPGFDLTIGGDRIGEVGANATMTVSRMAPGPHDVALSLATASNCTVTGDNPVSVSVTNRALTSLLLEVACTPAEKRIAFVIDSKDGQWIAATNTTGSVTAMLTQGYEPAWSADGRIFFSNMFCDYYDTDCSGGIGILNTDTYATTFPEYGRLSSDPALSPDGNALVFSKFTDADPRLFILHSDSTATMLDTHIYSRFAKWSPDGSRLVFQCATPNTFLGICVINSDGTGLQHLTDGVYEASSPQWSPDGSRIAFATNQFATPANNFQRDVEIMKADGSEPRRLTTGDEPAWSPDGSRLVFATLDGLFTIGADGSNRTRLTSGRHHAPAWR